MNNQAVERLIKCLGNQEVAAKALGVKQPTMSCYLRGVWPVPAIRALRAEEATKGKVKAHELCPDLKLIGQ